MPTLRFFPDCVWAQIGGRLSPEFLDAIDKALCFYEPGFRFTPAYKRHVWDGKRHLFDKATLRFPAGLAHKVVAALHETMGPGHAWKVQDERPLPTWSSEVIPELLGITLFSDQREAIQAGKDCIRGCLCLATGFGKTEVIAALLKAGTPARGVVVVPRKRLMAQTADRLAERLGERVGMIGDGHLDIRRRVTVGIVNSLYHNRAKLSSFFHEQGMLFYDEAHTIALGMSFPVLQAIHAPVRIGLSATIKEASRRTAVEAFLGPIILERNAADVALTGRTGLPVVYMIRVGGMVGEQDTFDEQYRKGISQNVDRNDKIVDAVTKHVSAGRKVLVLCVSIAHGKELARRTNARFLYGETHLDQIQDSIRAFDAGRVSALVMSTIGDMGIDLPTLDTVILAGAGKSPLRTVQRAGRPRVTPGKTVKIIDFFDMSSGLMRSHSQERYRTFVKKKFPTHVVDSVDMTV